MQLLLGKKMNPRIALFLIVLITLALTAPVYAQNTIPGVSEGDVFDYSYSFYWESTNPTITTPQAYTELNETESFTLTVVDITGSVLTLDSARHFRNSTEKTERGTIDIVNEIIEAPFGFLILASNIKAGDKMYSLGGNAVFTETIQKNYPNGQRETNHRFSETTGEDRYQKIEAYYDKSTGVAYEYIAENQESSNSYVTITRESMTLIASSIWTIPEFPMPIIAMLLLIAFSAISVITMKLRRKGKAEQ